MLNLVTGLNYETILAIKCKRIVGDKLGEKTRGENWERKWARNWERIWREDRRESGREFGRDSQTKPLPGFTVDSGKLLGIKSTIYNMKLHWQPSQ